MHDLIEGSASAASTAAETRRTRFGLPRRPAPRGGASGILALAGGSLASRLIVAMMALVILTAIGVGVLVYRSVQSALLPHIGERLRIDMKQRADLLETRTIGAKWNVVTVAASGPIDAYVAALAAGGRDPDLGGEATAWRERIETLFLAQLAAKPDYLQFRLIRADGQEIARVDRPRPGAPARILPQDQLQSKAGRDYLPATMALGPGEYFTSRLDLNRERGVIERPILPVLRVATPVDGPDGRFGILILNLDMYTSLERARADLPDRGALYVVDADGNFLVHPDRAREFAFELGDPLRLADDLPALADLIRDVGAQGGTGVWTSQGGGKTFAAWQRAKLAGDTAVTVIETVPNTVLRAAVAARSSAVLGGGIAVFAAAILAILVARSLARPIVAMTRAVEATGNGHQAGLPVTRTGEIGVLARALQRYMDAERFYGAAIETSNDAIIITAPNGTILRWNTAATTLFGIGPDVALGWSIDAVIGARATRQEDVPLLQLVSDKARDGNTLDIGWSANGDQITDVALRTSPVRGADGTLIGYSVIGRDVTERREAEEMFRLSVEHSPAGKILMDPGGRIILVNTEIERAFGYGRDELLGRNAAMLFADELDGAFADALTQPCEASPTFVPVTPDQPVLGRRRSGETFPVKVGLTRIRRRSGAMTLAAFVDMTSYHHDQQALQQRTMELERSNADLMQFAYVASHDLQEPLRMVASFTQLLADRYKGQLDERADKYIHFAVDGAKRMQQLINDLLVYSRVGGQTRPLTPTDTAAVWKRVVAQCHTMIVEAGARVQNDPLPTVIADAEQVGRVLQNLLSNAIKFRGETAPVVALTTVREGKSWRFTMTDNGVGFNENDAHRIFDMFQRLHDRGAYEGTGLGLAIAKRIVEQHNGRIWATSAPGQGAAFHFTLKAATPALDDHA